MPRKLGDQCTYVVNKINFLLIRWQALERDFINIQNDEAKLVNFIRNDAE